MPFLGPSSAPPGAFTMKSIGSLLLDVIIVPRSEAERGGGGWGERENMYGSWSWNSEVS